MKRDWTEAIAKCRYEGQCRACGSLGPLDPAHIVPRSRGAGMDPLGIVPLCRGCHTAFDSGELELLGSLSREEQAHAVGLVGVVEVYRRTTVGVMA